MANNAIADRYFDSSLPPEILMYASEDIFTISGFSSNWFGQVDRYLISDV